jgi:hypothetical protein
VELQAVLWETEKESVEEHLYSHDGPKWLQSVQLVMEMIDRIKEKCDNFFFCFTNDSDLENQD